MEGKNTVFDIFIRNYESGKPLITMTVSGGMTIGKLKRAFTENCKLLYLYTYKKLIRPSIIESDVFYPEK